MVREHGWQLPAHSFQNASAGSLFGVVYQFLFALFAKDLLLLVSTKWKIGTSFLLWIIAITVFCLLVVAFYAFFVPFLGGRIWMYVLIGSYSPVALLVFILYVRCTAINPADPGIMSKFDRGGSKQVNKNEELSKDNQKRIHEYAVEHSSISSGSRSSIARMDSSRKSPIADLGGVNIPEGVLAKKRYNLRGIFCAIFVLGDCRILEDTRDNEESNGQALYCTLCDAEVHHMSKHCRSCDKCVHGFDHHCRWLNNCVGIKNYASFIALMATSLVWLVLEACVGIVVFVHCFVDKKSVENEITEHLGNGFRRAPFAAVVAVCSCVSIWASIHLGELFFFHMILIKKGMTTYDYVMMMRAMSMDQAGDNAEEAFHNSRSSPSGSATTGLSGGSFLGLDNTGAWCTPPRVFGDYRDEVVPHLEPGMVPSTDDPDAARNADRGAKVPRPVQLSAWRLAKLDSKEAMKAAARARASSSVLRPIHGRQLTDSDFSSSGNASVRSSVSTDMGPNKENKNDPRMSPSRHSFAKSLGSRDRYKSGTHSVSSFGSPSHVIETVTLSPLPQGQGLGRFSTAISVSTVFPDRTLPSHKSTPLGVDEKIMQNGSKPLFRDIKRTYVVWDQEAGRYVSVPISAAETRHNRPSFQTSLPNYDIPAQSSSSSVGKSPLQHSEKLMYSGESIFFGGPLLNPPMRESLRNDGGLSSRENPDTLVENFLRDSRFKRDSVSNQIPVFVPSGYNPNSLSGAGSK